MHILLGFHNTVLGRQTSLKTKIEQFVCMAVVEYVNDEKAKV